MATHHTPKSQIRKTALITGASRGIGRAVAERLAQEGYDLIITSRTEKALAEVAAACEAKGASVYVYAADLGAEETPKKLADFCREKFPTLDVLVNNAGNPGGGRVQEADLERWDRCLNLNFRGLVHLTRHCVSLLTPERSTILNVSSISGMRPSGNSAMYSSTKHAVNGFSHSIFEDLREKGVKVCVLCPGFVATDMVRAYQLDESKMIQPEDLADAAMYVINSRATVCPVEIVLRPQYSPYLTK